MPMCVEGRGIVLKSTEGRARAKGNVEGQGKALECHVKWEYNGLTRCRYRMTKQGGCKAGEGHREYDIRKSCKGKDMGYTEAYRGEMYSDERRVGGGKRRIDIIVEDEGEDRSAVLSYIGGKVGGK